MCFTSMVLNVFNQLYSMHSINVFNQCIQINVLNHCIQSTGGEAGVGWCEGGGEVGHFALIAPHMLHCIDCIA